MIYCPNKNSQEFKDLVSSVGENRAYFLWNKYEGNVPENYYNQTIKTNDGIILVSGNENLYKKYNLLNKNGKTKNISYNEGIKWVKSLNQSSKYNFLLRNTPEGYRIFIAEKSDSLFGPKFLIDIVTPEGFTNRVFESNMQLGELPNDAHLSEKGYNYRVLSQNEIDAISESGGVFAREGKQKGGNKNTKYWTKGNNKNWYGDKSNLETIRVKQNNFKENEVVKAENVEVYNKATKQFESLKNTKNYTNQLTYTQALEKARELLPNFKEEDLIFFTKEAMFGTTGRNDALGMYRGGSVFVLDKQGKGTIDEYILRHELFHKIFTEYLTEKEQRLIIENLGTEENLAVDFQHWVNTDTERPGKIKEIFYKILRFLGLLKANHKDINEFFKQIENRMFSINQGNVSSEPKYLTEIQKKFSGKKVTLDEEGNNTDAAQNFKILTKRFLQDFNSFTEEGLKIGNNNYIITGHNEIKELIRHKLALEIKDMTIALNAVNEALLKNPEDNNLLSKNRKLLSDIEFNRLYDQKYNFIYEQMFPNSLNKNKKLENIENLRYLFETEETTTDDTTDSDITLASEGKNNAFSFQEEVYDSYEKTSTKVKSILSNVYDPQREAYISWAEAYKISLELLNDLPAEDLDKWISLLNTRVGAYKKSTYLAIFEKLKDLKTKATIGTYIDTSTKNFKKVTFQNNLDPNSSNVIFSDLNRSTEVLYHNKENFNQYWIWDNKKFIKFTGITQSLPKNAKFLNLDNTAGEETFIIAYDKDFDISKIEKPSDIEVFLKPGSYELVVRDRKRSTKDFIRDILFHFEKLDNETFKEFDNNVILLNTLRTKRYYNQALTELLQNMTSQKENERMIGSKETDETGTTFTYYNAVKESVERSVRSDISDKISVRLYTSALVEEFIKKTKDSFFNQGRPYVRSVDQLKAIKTVLNELGFSSYNYHNISDYSTSDLYNALKHFLYGSLKTQTAVGKIAKVGKEVKIGQYTYQESIGAILEDEGSLKDVLSKFLRFNSEIDRPGMSKKANGKMVYNFTPSSNGMDILRRLSRKNYLTDKNELPYENGFEYLQTDYFKLNPFNPFGDIVKSIYQVGIHDGIVATSTYGHNKSVTEYTKEDLKGFFDRTFNFGFLSTVNKGGNNLKYFQFSSPVSNRPNVHGSLINLMSNTEFDIMLEQVLKQIVARPDHKDVQNYDRKSLTSLDKIGNIIKRVYPELHTEVRNAEGKKIKDQFSITEKEISSSKFLNTIKRELRAEIRKDAEILFKQIVENEMTFSSSTDENGLVRIYKLLKASNRDFLDDNLDIDAAITVIKNQIGVDKYFETWGEVKARYAKAASIDYTNKEDLNNKVSIQTLKEAGFKKQYKVNNNLKTAILPLLDLYLKNDYINSYFLDQITMGGSEFFKSDIDKPKRRSGAFAPGLKGLVNSEIGMAKTFRTAVIEDPTRDLKGKNNYLHDLLISTGIIDKSMNTEEQGRIYNKFVSKFDKFNPTDAQGYMLPERASELQKGFGESYQIGNVLKPAHYEIDKLGIPRMVKYSAIVLTDDLVANFPQLGHLRDKMRKANTGEIVYYSAFKVGSPKNRLGMKEGKFDEETFNNLFKEGDYEFSEESIVELSNERYKLQLNPEHDLDSKVAKPTQLFYFLKILGTNLAAADKVYTSLSKIMDIETNEFKAKFLNGDDTFKAKAFVDYLVTKGASSATEVYHEILAELYNDVADSKGKNPKPWNFPGIEDKIITQFSSTLQNDIVQTKFKGTKLVLMSQTSVNLAGKERLKYKVDENGNLYAEVYLPRHFIKEEIRQKMETQESHIFFDPELLGFRIPSSELHSGIPIRVAGFHDLGKGMSNVIIAPEELVPLHGSDFDVDALYVITQETKDGKPIGYKTVNSQYVIMKEEEFINSIQDLSEEEKSKMLKSYYKNVVSNTIIKTISSKENRERMISPISMTTVKDVIDRILEKNSNLDPSNRIDESSALDKQKVHSSSMNGRDGTGIFANFAKGIAYILDSSSDTESPFLLNKKENLPYFTNDLPLDTLHDKIHLWEHLDSLLNAAIDNVKEQILPKLNLNSTTIPTFSMMLALGVELEEAATIMVQPIIKHLSNISGRERNTSKGVISATNILKSELSKFLTLPGVSQENITFINNFINNSLEDFQIILTTDELQHSISNEIISDSNIGISDIEDVRVLITQAKVLENYKRTESIVNDFNKLVRYLAIIRDLPVFSNKINELLDLKSQIWTEEGKTVDGFPFNVDNFFVSNPHIAKSDEILQLQSQLLQDNFFKHSANIQDFFKNLPHVSFDVNKFTDIKYKQDEFVKFVYSSLYFSDSNLNIIPFKYTPKKFKTSRELLEQEAFVQHFVNKVRILKNVIPNNYFLKRFSTSDSSYSADLKKLSFFLDSKVTPLDKIEFELAFREFNKYEVEAINIQEYNKITDNNLKYKFGDNLYRVIKRDLTNDNVAKTSDLQKEFVQYNILMEGMRNSSSSYSQLLPGFIYREQYYDYENLMKDILNNFELDQLSNIYQVFSSNISVSNTDKMIDFRGSYEFKNDAKNNVTLGNKTIYYDLIVDMNSNASEFIKIKHPVYKKNFLTQEELEESIANEQTDPEDMGGFEEKEKPDYYQTKVYKLVYSNDSKAYYQYVTQIKNNKVYKSNELIFEDSKKAVYDRFSPDYFHIKYSSLAGNKFTLANETNSNMLLRLMKGNDMPVKIAVSDVNDALRLNTKFIQIEAIDEISRIVTFKEIPDSERPLVPLYSEIIKFEDSKETLVQDKVDKSRIKYTNERMGLAELLQESSEFLDPTHHRTIELLKDFINFDLTVEFGHTLGKDVKGTWGPNGTSFIIKVSEEVRTKSRLSHVITHELLHHVVYNILHKNENLLTTHQKEAKRRLEALYKAAIMEGKADNKNASTTYGLTNLDEFISEAFSNRKFQQWLASKKINKKSIWTRFKEAIINMLGISDNTLLFDVINSTMELISNDSDLIDPDLENKTITVQNLKIDPKSYVEPLVEIRRPAENIGLTVAKDSQGKEKNYYSSIIGNLKRSTNDLEGLQTFFIEGYNFNKYKKGIINFNADKLFGEDEEIEVYIPKFSKNMKKADYITESEKVQKEDQARGKMTEALFRYMITKDEALAEEIIGYQKVLPPDIYDKILLLQDNEVIRKIVFNKMQTNLLNNDGSKIDFSIPTFSKALERAGTIDMMIKHPDGEYSLFDMKTSQFFSAGNFTNMFSYGLTNDLNIPYTDRNKAKLQIMFYALMVRLNNPNVKFKKISIVHLPVTSSKDEFLKLIDRNTLSDDIVETNSYLEMIQKFLKDKKNQVKLGLIKEGEESLYEKLEKEYKVNGGSSIEDLFNSRKYSNYYDPNSVTTKSNVNYGQGLVTAKSEEEKILQELSILSSTQTDDLKILNPETDEIEITRFGEVTKIKSLERYRKERIKELIQRWITLTGDTNLTFLSTKDIDFTHLWVGSNKDVDENPIFTTWNKFKVARQNKARAVSTEKIAMLKLRADKVIPKSLPINLNSQRKIFGKFLKREHSDLLGKEIERLVHKNKNDAEYAKLSKDEKDFVDYLNDTFASYFAKDSYLNSVGSFFINHKGQVEGITHLDVYNKGKDKFEYYPGWFPKTPILPEEYQERIIQEKGVLEGSKNLLYNWGKRQLTKYYENLFSINEDTAAIPIKYLGNSEIEENQLYSVKLDQVFEKFIDTIERKIHLDEVYHTGRSITMLLQEDNDITGASSVFDAEQKQWKQRYSNLIDFIKTRINYEIKDIPITKVEYLSKELIVGNKKIDFDKSMLLLSQGATASVMWLKPISGLGNFTMGQIVKYKEALKYSIGKRIITDLQAKEIDFTFTDAAWGEKEYLGLIKDFTSEEKMYSNKLFLIAEKFGYLADNYRFGSNSRRFKSDRNPLFNSDNMYIFHTIGENWISYTTLAAQLNHYTVKVDGKDVPIHKLYKVVPLEAGSKFSKLEWIGPKRTIKDGNVLREVEGITDDEMYRFKAVSARMQGDYRREEFIKLETYALGKITVVLKKFFTRLILNGIEGKKPMRALGWYNEVEQTDENGNKITALEWEARNIEGRWRTLFNALTALVRLNSQVSAAGGFSEYWGTLNHEQKLNLIDVLVTASFLLMTYGGYVIIFGDTDEDDTWKKAWKTYLIDNASQQYNFIDLLRTARTVATPVVVNKAFDFVQAGTQLFLLNGIDELVNDGENIRTEKGDIRGLNMFLKSIPYTAFGQDFYNKVNNINADQYGFFDFIPDKLR